MSHLLHSSSVQGALTMRVLDPMRFVNSGFFVNHREAWPQGVRPARLSAAPPPPPTHLLRFLRMHATCARAAALRGWPSPLPSPEQTVFHASHHLAKDQLMTEGRNFFWNMEGGPENEWVQEEGEWRMVLNTPDFNDRLWMAPCF